MRHARGRHDAGCEAFGVAISELHRLGAATSDPGSTAYVLEAVTRAAALVECDEQWWAERAWETLAAELDSRITPEPSVAAAEALQALRLGGGPAEGRLHTSQE